MRNFRNRLILVVIPGKVQDKGPPELFIIYGGGWTLNAVIHMVFG